MRSLLLTVCVVLGMGATAQVTKDSTIEKSVTFSTDGASFTFTESKMTYSGYLDSWETNSLTIDVVLPKLIFSDKEDVGVILSNNEILSFINCSLSYGGVCKGGHIYSVNLHYLNEVRLKMFSENSILHIKVGELEGSLSKETEESLVMVINSFLNN